MTKITRRAVLGTAAAALAAPHIARAKPTSIVVATSGGKLEETFTAAYYKPFAAKTGIEIVNAVNTYSKLKAMVEANAVEWDVMQIELLGGSDQCSPGVVGKAGLRGDQQD